MDIQKSLLGLVFILGFTLVQAQVPSTDIYLFDIDLIGERLNYRNMVRITDREGYDNQPSFTFTGNGLLFTSIRENDQADIFKYNLLTGETRQLTFSPESEFSPKEIPGTRRFSAVRVEKDSAQRIWRFPLRGKGMAKLMVPHIPNVGYYCWMRRDELALFLLEDPFVLKRENLVLNQSSRLDSKPGRCLQTMNTEFSLLYVQKKTETEWFIKKRGMITRKKEEVIQTLEGVEDFCWSSEGFLLMGKAGKLFIYIPGKDTTWRFVGNLGIGTFDRMAVSNDGRKLAVVAERN